MDINKTPEFNFYRKILCSLFGHKIINNWNVAQIFKQNKELVFAPVYINEPITHKTFLTPKFKNNI